VSNLPQLADFDDGMRLLSAKVRESAAGAHACRQCADHDLLSTQTIMHRSMLFARVAIAAPALVFFAACSDAKAPTEVGRISQIQAKLDLEEEAQHAGGIVAHDACDPATFNDMFGEGTCVKEGHVTLDDFVAQLQSTHVAKGWSFTPNQLAARFGVDLLGNNIGGETHTFTPVKAFGGGFFLPLNELSDNPVPAPECLTLDLAEDLVVAGAKYTIEKEELAEVVDASGLARVQCCIHPWMRATVKMQHGAA
jgi:hypothetical protein